MKLRAPFLVAALATVACLACASRPALESGTWRAWLDSPGGELPFGLELTHGDDAWSAHIVNGSERIEVGHVDLDGDRLTLRIEHYDATVEATRTSPTRLDGRWWKTGKLGAFSELPFHAAHGETHRFTPLAAAGEDGSVGGRWAVRFGDEEEDPAVAEFEQGDDGEVTGTFMTTAGDYRYLAGSFEGALRSLDDPEFAGRARILEVFGTWCPNCNDATEYLVDLHGRYRERGLSIVGLAFEMTGEFARDAEQVRVYREYHGIEYPILVAGTSDKAEASEAFPLIERVKSYPTTIFMDGDGNVHTVYSGFSGPATGEAYTRLHPLFENTIEELLGDE